MQQDAISSFRKNLNDLEETISQAKRVPLSSLCMVERERTLSMLDSVQRDLPSVITECEGVVQNQISILSEANERAEQTKQNAVMRANQLVNDAKNQAQQTTAQAQQQAQEMLQKAQQQATAMLREAQEQTKKMVADAEQRAGRRRGPGGRRLRGRRGDRAGTRPADRHAAFRADRNRLPYGRLGARGQGRKA